MNRDATASVRTIFLVLVLSTGGIRPAWPAQGDAPAAQTVVLRPGRGPWLRIDLAYDFRNPLPPFVREPVPDGPGAARGLIPTVPPTPILRNIAGEALYLKTDHTRDFAAGSFATYKSRYDHHVVFEGLSVLTEREGLVIPYTVDLYTYETGCAGWLQVESGWTGEFELAGEKCTLSVADNLDGRIDENDRLSLQGPKLTRGMMIRDCPVPQILSLADRTLRLDFTFKSMPPEVVLETAVTEVRPELGQLDIQAGGCWQLRLRDDRHIVWLNRPAGVISVPVGNYRVDHCILNEEPGRRLAPRFVGCDGSVSILPGQTTSLRVGAPLSNGIEVSRDRNLLHLKHQLTGAGGERYECYDPRDSPAFAIYKGPLKIAGGTFPFG